MIACTSSPRPGAVTTTATSAARHDVDLGLPDAHGLDDDARRSRAASSTLTTSAVERDRPPSCPRVASERMKTPVVGGVALHADAIAEQRAARERARRIDGHHADPLARGAVARDQRVDERRLADARACR